MTIAQLIFDCKNTLGEGPVWTDDTQKLYWVDIEQSFLWSFDPETQETQSYKMPERLCSFAFCSDGRILGAFASQLAFFDLSSSILTPILDFEKEISNTRSNDGCCDLEGRFIIGGCDESGDGRAISQVYSLGTDLKMQPLISKIACTNSICFSPDNSLMYFADSPEKRIMVYDYNLATGAVSNQRVFADLADQPGVPDGSTIDAEGFLWNAQWGGYRVTRHRPDGTIERVIDVPVPNPSCVCFGGRDLNMLYITTARFWLTPEQIEKSPQSGGLFVFETDIKGLIKPFFTGKEI